MSVIVLVRHGETEWSAAGRHTSVTDVGLTPRGVEQGALLARRLAGRRFAAVWCSPRRRARQTAELAGLAVTDVTDDLAEWAYGDFEGLTSAQISVARPEWSLWTDGAPEGELPVQVQTRVDRVLARARPLLEGDQGDVALVAHGHVLRVLGARWVGLSAAGGGLLTLDPAALCELGYEHGQPVITRWNQPPDVDS